MNTSIAYAYPRKEVIPNNVLGMILLIVTELMFFAGLISAYIVNRAGRGEWPPAGQPRLPIEMTAVNTFILLASAFTVFFAVRSYESNPKKAILWLKTTILLGTVFVSVQGFEWMRLLQFGLTTQSGLYGAFFYTIIGTHGFHVLVGLSILLWLAQKLKSISLTEKAITTIKTCSLYWYFVVGIWPILYMLVYLY